MKVLTDLPNDLQVYLQRGRQLSYNAEDSDIGKITLKRADDLAPSVIRTFPGSDDPYTYLDGMYQIEVYDLVAESDDYDPEGLLCWIVALQQFGCIDPEHGTVMGFQNLSWTELAKTPQPYLDAQWNQHEQERLSVRPWLHFPLRLNKRVESILPYGENCRIHNIRLVVEPRPLVEIDKQRKLDDRWDNYLTAFPCAGVPVNTDEILLCVKCREAEERWATG